MPRKAIVSTAMNVKSVSCERDVLSTCRKIATGTTIVTEKRNSAEVATLSKIPSSPSTKPNAIRIVTGRMV
jgi:hypothetical protein